MCKIKVCSLFFRLLAWTFILLFTKAAIRGDRISLTFVIENLFPAIYAGNIYTGILWFLQSLLALYLVFPFLKACFDYDYGAFRMLLVTICILQFVPQIISFSSTVLLIMDAPIMSDLCTTICQWFRGFIPLINSPFIVFFMLGGVIRESDSLIEDHRKTIIVLGACGWIASMLYAILAQRLFGSCPDSLNYFSMFTFLILPGWFAASTYYRGENRVLRRMIASIGSSTLGIYLIHTIIKIALYQYVVVDILPFYYRFIILILVFLVSWLICVIISKVPVLKWLVRL